MTIGRAEAQLIADVLDATQRALGRALTRSEMDRVLAYADEVGVDAMRESERSAVIAQAWGGKGWDGTGTVARADPKGGGGAGECIRTRFIDTCGFRTDAWGRPV